MREVEAQVLDAGADEDVDENGLNEQDDDDDEVVEVVCVEYKIDYY